MEQDTWVWVYIFIWNVNFLHKNNVVLQLALLVLVYTQEGSLWSIVLRCDDHTGIFTCDGCARDPYFYVPAETQSYVIKLSCSRKVLAANGDWTRNLWVTTISSQPRYPLRQQDTYSLAMGLGGIRIMEKIFRKWRNMVSLDVYSYIIMPLKFLISYINIIIL